MDTLSRRSLLSLAAVSPFAFSASKIPVGLELFSVRNELKQDQTATVRAVAKMGYQIVEFFSPYYAWTPDQTKDVKKLLDDLGIKCLSTHNDFKNFAPENLSRTAELNNILGAKYVVMASAGRPQGVAGWTAVAETLNRATDAWKSAGLRAGYHNHQTEFMAGTLDSDRERPMDLLAANTHKDVMLQFDVGTCVEAGSDPVAWINQNPGRIRSMHCKDWAPGPDKGYRVLFGEGSVPWKEVFAAAEKTG
ncbi:MAG: sugar phosphate isomerase/epimerase, partial [Bryobacteraceae bacterium]